MEQRLQAALPRYLRRIVEDIYVERDFSLEDQAQIEHAMSELMERGMRLCVEFGVLNARDVLALECGHFSYPRERR